MDYHRSPPSGQWGTGPRYAPCCAPPCGLRPAGRPAGHATHGNLYVSVLSFGTAGCNLSCRFCQNWDISKSREIDTLADAASPEKLARVAKALGCSSIAFTYNDPVVFHEYAIDTAQACHEIGLKAVAVTAGYQCAEARREMYRWMDAANVDLKAFTE